jgi:hypothetical protein
MMKRKIAFVLAAFCAVALASAQNRERRNWGPPAPPPQQIVVEKTTVTGALSIVQGRIAVKSGDITYFTGGLRRFVGFIDGLKEDAQVTLEGNAFTSPQDANTKFLQINKMTLGGKVYDMAPPARAAGTVPGWGLFQKGKNSPGEPPRGR